MLVIDLDEDASMISNDEVIIKKRVAFSLVRITEFDVAVGDNPAVSSGVPIRLADEPVRVLEHHVDVYEKKRRGRRRRARDLQISRDEREQRLLENGIQIHEIVEAVRASRKIRHGRERSMHNKSWDNIHEKVEDTKLTLKKLIHVSNNDSLAIPSLGSAMESNQTDAAPPRPGRRRTSVKIQDEAALKQVAAAVSSSSTKADATPKPGRRRSSVKLQVEAIAQLLRA